MLPKKKRVTKDIFQIIMKKGNMLSNSLFSFRYLNQENPQYAFVVPKSVAKRAVVRNKLRRQGYNAIRTMDTLSGLGVFMYKKQNKEVPFSEIKESIKSLLNKAKII